MTRVRSARLLRSIALSFALSGGVLVGGGCDNGEVEEAVEELEDEAEEAADEVEEEIDEGT